MPALTFFKWSPGGNTTLLFPADGTDAAARALLAGRALDAGCLGGEQAGFVDMDAGTLRMAGGEFCVNASRAMGAQLAYAAGSAAPRGRATAPAARREHVCDISVSGWSGPVRLRSRGNAPLWRVEAVLRLPSCPATPTADGAVLVRLPGISHLLVPAPHGFPGDPHERAARLRERHGLDAEAAAGVVWWTECDRGPSMLPLVRVRDADTTFLEKACGSGALALALSLARRDGRREFSVMQPGGSPLDVRLFSEDGRDMAGVDGPVELVARGEVWLPDGLAP